uniref:Uncharacterized protein n=1 Tax=Ananas comosus var. bracteatus TaxID=296719 RepID=A0A6V7NXD6_ANACO|nr:unnamed protein product [Ananas comosus var. bracteatus]
MPRGQTDSKKAKLQELLLGKSEKMQGKIKVVFCAQGRRPVFRVLQAYLYFPLVFSYCTIGHLLRIWRTTLGRLELPLGTAHNRLRLSHFSNKRGSYLLAHFSVLPIQRFEPEYGYELSVPTVRAGLVQQLPPRQLSKRRFGSWRDLQLLIAESKLDPRRFSRSNQIQIF